MDPAYIANAVNIDVFPFEISIGRGREYSHFVAQPREFSIQLADVIGDAPGIREVVGRNKSYLHRGQLLPAKVSVRHLNRAEANRGMCAKKALSTEK
ncbi:MAG: hypothetical protein NVSMB52_11940 [Chloroflexota bacterium]